MNPMRLLSLIVATSLSILSAVATAQPTPEASEVRCDLVARIDAALAAGETFLIDRQSADGAWRSGVYGMFKDGASLSPRVLLTLGELPAPSARATESLRRGSQFLAGLLDDKGDVREGVAFPAYNAAIASRVQPERRSIWIDFLRARQLNHELGWEPNDSAFGGWGYSPSIPHKPSPGKTDPLATSNISATVCALQALRAAKIDPADAALRDALNFVQRCQNYSDDPRLADSVFDDGGFFFMPDDAAWNKAGVAGADRAGRVRFNSYGSATADGLRALLDAGLPAGHPRVTAARKWLESHFDPESNPGVFPADRQVLRNATYYYYAASTAQAFAQVGRSSRNVNCAESLSGSLIRRQRPDGAWSNPYTDGKEDEPLIATSDALTALSACRHALLTATDN